MAVALVVTGARSLQHAVDLATEARARLSTRDLATPEVERRLRDAEVAARTGHRRLSNPLVAPLRLVPVGGRQLHEVTTLASAAATMLDAGREAAVSARAALAVPASDAPGRLALLDQVAATTTRLGERLARVDTGSGKALVGPVRDRRAELVDKLAEARDLAARGTRAAQAMRSMLGRPDGRYLVLAANNAEMRAGSGMFLSAGVLEVHAGSLTLGDMESTGDLTLPGAGVAVTGDLADRWGWLHPGREWRNLGVSPRFDVTAELAARMWEAHGGGVVDGVVALDVEALHALLVATGPIDAGGLVDASNVVDLLTHDQYASLAPSGQDEALAARRERLGSIAREAVAAVSAGRFSPSDLAASLADATTGRHVLVWSRDQREEDGWRAAHVDGALGGDDLVLSVINRGGNKLDRFLEASARLRVSAGRAILDVSLRNTTPEGQSPYVEGPYPGAGAAAGEYLGLAAVNLPGWVGAPRIEGRALAAAGPDGPSRVVATEVRIPRGGAADVRVTFDVPRSGAIHVVPSARIPAVSWTANGVDWIDTEGYTVRW